MLLSGTLAEDEDEEDPTPIRRRPRPREPDDMGSPELEPAYSAASGDVQKIIGRLTETDVDPSGQLTSDPPRRNRRPGTGRRRANQPAENRELPARSENRDGKLGTAKRS